MFLVSSAGCRPVWSPHPCAIVIAMAVCTNQMVLALASLALGGSCIGGTGHCTGSIGSCPLELESNGMTIKSLRAALPPHTIGGGQGSGDKDLQYFA